MRILAVVPNLLGWAPGQRSTIEAWEPVLADAGIEVDYDVFETPELHDALYRQGGYARKAALLLQCAAARLRRLPERVRDHDAVYLYREAALAGPELLERVIARTGVPIVYELDDPLHVPYRSAYNGPLALLKFRGKVARICAMSAAVVANSSMIRSFAEQHSTNVWQIPSVVDERTYHAVPKERADPACVGWSGSPSTAPNLAVVADALRVLQRQGLGAVRLIGAERFDLPGVEHVARPWRAATEVEDLRRLDVGLAPLPDVPWNHHKFYMKLAQYMALGIVPVATPYGSTVEDIQHGENGFLASTTSEWVDVVQTLVHDDDLRARMSARAAADAAARYTVAANAEKIVGVFRSVVR